jgi:hypothetical protein
MGMTLTEMIQMSRKQFRKRPADEEHKIQCACVKWFRLQHKHLSHALFAVPNGGKRDAVTAAKMKAEGQLAGVADLILLYPNGKHHALLIEMKTETGRQADTQKAWQEKIEKHGYKYIICRSVDEFRIEINNYING